MLQIRSIFLCHTFALEQSRLEWLCLVNCGEEALRVYESENGNFDIALLAGTTFKEEELQQLNSQYNDYQTIIKENIATTSQQENKLKELSEDREKRNELEERQSTHSRVLQPVSASCCSI